MEAELGTSVRPLVDTTACMGMASHELYSLVASELGFPECSSNSELDVEEHAVIHCVARTWDLQERLCSLGRYSWVTRYLSLPDLCDKSNLAKIVSRCSSLSPVSTWDFFPRSWHLPAQHDIVRSMLQKGKHTYIVKPTDGCQGDGIFLVKDLKDLSANMAGKSGQEFVVQKYIEPLLLDGFKFDFRMYVCLIGGSPASPPMAFLCKEGLARFCAERYEEPNSRSMHATIAHLTNYSLNKESLNFERCGDTPEEVFDLASIASKRPLTVVLRQIELQHPKFDSSGFYSAVASMVQKIVAAMSPVIAASHRPWTGDGEVRSMQLLGFDVMLDEQLRPHLLEVNNSPSLRVDEVVNADEEICRDLFVAQFKVGGAGSASVNTVFSEGCLHAAYCTRSFYSADRRHGLHCMKAFMGCPAGWYITGPGDCGIYYNPAADSQSVPEAGWTVYAGRYASPGLAPPPRIDAVSVGLPSKNDSNLCFCSHSEMPHYHNDSVVDLCVKRIAMAGAFRLVGQLQSGSSLPSVESYIHVDASQADFYPVLRAVEVLFDSCGGVQKCFQSHVLQQACKLGAVREQDLDAFSHRLRSNDFSSRHSVPNAFRVYDFLGLLLQSSLASFPFSNTRDGLLQLLDSVEPGRQLLCVHAGLREDRRSQDEK